MKKRTSSIVVLMFAAMWGASHAAAPRMYVPTGDDDRIVVIDLEKDRIVGHIDELENAHGLSSSAGTEYLVAGSMRIRENEGVEAVRPGAVSEEEHRAHHEERETVSEEKAPGYVSIVHPRRGHVIRRIEVPGLTHHTAVSPDGRWAVAVHSGEGGITVIDLRAETVLMTVPTGARPNYAVFDSRGERLYVSNAGPGTITELAVPGFTTERELVVGREPEHIVMSPDNTRLYAANVGDGTVSVVDLEQGRVVETHGVGPSPHGIDVSSDGRWLFAASKQGETLIRIALATGESRTMALGPAPYHVTYVRGLDKLYVSSRKLSKIWVIDPAALKVTGAIELEKGVAHQMVIRDD